MFLAACVLALLGATGVGAQCPPPCPPPCPCPPTDPTPDMEVPSCPPPVASAAAPPAPIQTPSGPVYWLGPSYTDMLLLTLAPGYVGQTAPYNAVGDVNYTLQDDKVYTFLIFDRTGSSGIYVTTTSLTGFLPTPRTTAIFPDPKTGKCWFTLKVPKNEMHTERTFVVTLAPFTTGPLGVTWGNNSKYFVTVPGQPVP